MICPQTGIRLSDPVFFVVCEYIISPETFARYTEMRPNELFSQRWSCIEAAYPAVVALLHSAYLPVTSGRYRCLKCFNFDMCQDCFFTGRLSKNHKLTHPMHEYCTEVSWEAVRRIGNT